MTYTTRFVGIDISKSTLDLYVLPDEQSASFANSAVGIAELLAFLSSLDGIGSIILEPTGGYERRVVEALLVAQFPVAKINAKQIRQFAKACGQLSKTDKIDAFILADYGRRMDTRIRVQSSPQHTVLVDLVNRYKQLSHMIVQEKNRSEKQYETIRDWIDEILQTLLKQRRAVVDAMTACLEADPYLARKADVTQGYWATDCMLPAGWIAGAWQARQRTDCKAGWRGSTQS